MFTKGIISVGRIHLKRSDLILQLKDGGNPLPSSNIYMYLESEEQTEQALNEVDLALRLAPQGLSGMGTICELIALESCFHILHCARNLTRMPCHLTVVLNTVLVVHSAIQVTTSITIPIVFCIILHNNLHQLK
jgi:hypothetical protein